MSNPLGINMMTVFGMPPVDYVHLAADLGCSHLSTSLSPVTWKLDCFHDWSLRDDVQLRRDMAEAMRDRGISLSLADGFIVRPGVDVESYAEDLDVMAELGAERASSVSMEPDQPRALDQFARLAELTAERGMGFVLEFAPPHPINTLDMALAAIRHVGQSHFGLLVDSMHLFRTGAKVQDLAAIDPGVIRYVQLCDVPLSSDDPDYYREACFERLSPGEGELQLVDLMRAVPGDVPVGLEIPMRSRVESAEDLRRVLGQAVSASREILAAARSESVA